MSAVDDRDRARNLLLNAANISGTFANKLVELIDNVSLKRDARRRLAAACVLVSLTHHNSIATLIAQERIASAFALLRPQMESLIRGCWIAFCASEAQFERLQASPNYRFPRHAAMVDHLIACGAFEDDSFKAFAVRPWPALCDFTHSGIRAILAHVGADSISPQFDTGEVCEALQLSNTTASLAGIAIADFADLEDAAKEIGKAGKVANQQIKGLADL